MKTYTLFFSLFFFLFPLNNTVAQNFEIQWQNCFGDQEKNYASCIAQTSQGYLFAMRATEPGPPNFHGNTDVWLIHIDTLGNKLWENCYGGSGGDWPLKIIKASENDYYLYAMTNSTDGDVQSENRGNTDIWIVKMNSNGNILWERCYGGSHSEEGRTAQLCFDGGLLLLSRITAADGDISQHFGSSDIWLTKIDSLGNIEWERTYGNQYLDNAIDILLTSDNCILLTGANDKAGGMVTCHPYADYDADVWLLKLDMQGNIIWQYCYGGTYYDLAYYALEVEDGYVVSASTNSNDGDVSGFHGSPGQNGNNDLWVFKIDFNGNMLWQRCFGGTGSEFPYHFSKTEDGNYIIVGRTSSDNGDVVGNHSYPGGKDIWMFEFVDGGELLWQQCIGGWGDEYFEIAGPVYKKSDYNYVISANSNHTSDDVQCEIPDPSGDAWVFEIKDTTVDIPQTSANQQLKVYPNPANNYVVFDNPVIARSGASKQSPFLTITNTLGQLVAQIEIKDTKTVWDTRKIQNGVYFYFLEMERKRYAGKVVVQR
jgi:hypothetical protein